VVPENDSIGSMGWRRRLTKTYSIRKEKDLPLLALVKEGESDTLEFKVSLLKPKRTRPGIQEIKLTLHYMNT
jgi:hypothetical protein